MKKIEINRKMERICFEYHTSDELMKYKVI